MDAGKSHAAATKDASCQTKQTRYTKTVSRWLLVASAFVVNYLTDGLTLSFGVLLVEFLEQFQHERATTAIIGSLAAGVFHLVGPLAGLLSDMLGGRAVVIIGTLISFVGFVGATFSDSLASLSISYGFFGGLGFGLMFLPTNAAIIHHFDERRALATGIAVCGSGVGTFVNSLLIRFLIDTYTWRWAILILAGMVLHGIPCGLLLNSTGDESKGENDTQRTKSSSGESRDNSKDEIQETQDRFDDVAENRSVAETQQCNCCTDLSNGSLSIETQNHQKSCDFKETDTKTQGRDCCLHQKHKNEMAVVNNQINDDKMTTCSENERQVYKSCFNTKQTKVVLQTNLRLLLDFKCICFLLSTFVVNLAFIIPYTLLPDQVVEGGMTKYQASWLVSSIGMSNTFSRVIFGWLADKKFVNRMLLFESLLVLIGINTALSPLLTSFESKMGYSCVHGFLLGGYVMLIPVVLADLFGARVIEESYGLAMFAIGIAVIISLPIGGWIFDQTGSYDLTFVVAGSEFAGGGLILLCPLVVQRLRNRKSFNITS